MSGDDPVAEPVYDPGTGATYLRAIGALSGLVFFAATEGNAPFVLCGSSVHVLDRWQSGDSPGKQVGHTYVAALYAYARQLGKLPDEAAITEFVPPDKVRHGSLSAALYVLWRETKDNSGWVTRPVQLTGHARVLAVMGDGTEGPPGVLATPLYVEYARRG